MITCMFSICMKTVQFFVYPTKSNNLAFTVSYIIALCKGEFSTILTKERVQIVKRK